MTHTIRETISILKAVNVRKSDASRYYRSMMHQTQAQGEKAPNVYLTVDNSRVSFRNEQGQREVWEITQ